MTSYCKYSPTPLTPLLLEFYSWQCNYSFFLQRCMVAHDLLEFVCTLLLTVCVALLKMPYINKHLADPIRVIPYVKKLSCNNQKWKAFLPWLSFITTLNVKLVQPSRAAWLLLDNEFIIPSYNLKFVDAADLLKDYDFLVQFAKWLYVYVRTDAFIRERHWKDGIQIENAENQNKTSFHVIKERA